MRGYILAFALFSLAGCNDWNAKAPPESKQRFDLVLPDSYAHMAIQVSASEFGRSVLEAYTEKPLDKATTNEVAAKLLVKKWALVRKPQDYVVRPYTPAGCVTKTIFEVCPKQVAQNISEKCWQKFQNIPEDCARTIWVEQYLPCNEATQRCWPEVKELIGSHLVSALQIQDSLVSASVSLNHQLFLRDLSLQASGDGLNFQADMELRIAIDLKPGTLHVTEAIEGDLQCSSRFEATGRADTILDDALQIQVSLTDLKIDEDGICIPSAVETAGFSALSSADLLKKPLERAIFDELRRKLSEIVDAETAGNPDFHGLLQRFSTDLSKTLELGSGISLMTNPKALAISQIYSVAADGESALRIDLAVVGRPAVYLPTNAPPSRSNPNLLVSVVDDLAGDLRLGATGRLSLVSADNLLLREITKFLKNKHPRAPLAVAAAHLYQSGQYFVIRLTLVRKSDGKLLGSGYLWAIPNIDEKRHVIRLQGVRFDSDTRRVLNKVAPWLLSSRLEESVEQTVAFRYGGLVEYFQKDLHGFKVENGSTVLLGDLKSVKVESIWIADSAINISASAKGDMTLSLKRNAIP